MKLLGKLILLKNHSKKTLGLTVVPFQVVEDEDGDYYNCIIVRGKLLSDKGIGHIVSLNLDFHSTLEAQGHTIIELFDLSRE